MRTTAEVNAIEEATARCLTFRLGTQEYGLRILEVREIIGLLPVTPVPGTPTYIKGIINLRGQVIPIIDLRAKFGMAEARSMERASIIILQGQGEALAGILVDRVCEVIDIAQSAIEPPPDLGDSNTEVLLGCAKCENDMKLLLDVEHILEFARTRSAEERGTSQV